MIWVLLLIVVFGNGVSVTEHVTKSQEQCEQLGNAIQKSIDAGYICFERMER